MMTSAQRMAPTVISMVVAGIWSVQVIILVYDVITKGDIWQNLASVIQAYLIVIGLPNAIFSVYVYVMHQWWEWFYKQGGFYVPPPPQPEVIIDPTPTPAPKPTPKPNPWLCSENNWTCWEDLGRVCKGTTCNDNCFDHPEFKGTAKEGTDPNFKCHQENPLPNRFDSHFCYILDNGMHWCGAITNTEQYGYLPKGFPLNLDGSPVDPSLYNPLTNFSPIYVYYFPEQWNPANPLYPLPPYPNRPAPPT